MLTERDRNILHFENTRTRGDGDQIRDRFQLTPTRYQSVLNRILDDPEALREHPLEVNRLRRIRDAKTTARRSRRFAA